jgi:hypothetical protein
MKSDAVKQLVDSPEFESMRVLYLGTDLDAGNIAAAIKQISDTYNQGAGSPRIWATDLNRAAYFSYFLPLNTIRFASVLRYGHEVGFFNGFEHVSEFGSGPATAQWTSWWEGFRPPVWQAQEESNEARHMHTEIAAQIKMPLPDFTAKPRTGAGVLAVASYVMTETDLPPWFLDCEGICLVEASTERNARKLMAYRQTLLDAGFTVWAPCTHQQACPLLVHSKRDWCHMRVHWQRPQWFLDLERRLPMKNATVTFSYLLARRGGGAPDVSGFREPARIIGDTLKEKGKTRQAVCRGPEREFLSWLHRNGEPRPFLHGERIDLPDSLEKKGSELRWP